MYILITSVILVVLNLYAASTMRNLIFQGKKTSLGDKVSLISSTLEELPEMNADTAGEVLTQMSGLNVSRIILTDAGGRVIYDTVEDNRAFGKIVLFPEVVLALEGNDVFCSKYNDGVLESRAASPVLRNKELVGCIYLLEYDVEQGSLIRALQQNILWISLILEGAVILFSFVFSEVFSRRMREIFTSIRIIRDGDYSHKLTIRGSDELTRLALEFNDLTVRLQESEDRRRQFVSDASHELKTPLTSIKLLSDSILQNAMDADTILEFVQDIGNEADRLTRMTQKLLYLTKMDAEQRVDHEIADIHETARKVLRMLEPVAKLHQITMVCETVPNATVLVVEDDLYQILFNLVENGIKYNKPHGMLTLSLLRQKDDWILTVTDTGMGIPPEAMPHIFERFYRVDKARSRQAGGSGLGLSIVYGMVVRNGGKIQVVQPETGGSSFVVTFPAFDLEEDTLWLDE